MSASASIHWFAFWFFIVLPIGVLVIHEGARAWLRRDRRLQREGWRAHRAYMDSIKPQRWTKP